MPYLAVAHQEDIAEDEAEHASIFEGVTDGSFRHDDVIFFDEAGNHDFWWSSGPLAFDLVAEGFPADEMKGARDYPFDIVGQAGQNI